VIRIIRVIRVTSVIRNKTNEAIDCTVRSSARVIMIMKVIMIMSA
jgi:hypothetical protein